MLFFVEKLKNKCILYALLFLLPLYSSGEPHDSIALQEARVAREAAERRAIQLEGEVAQLKKDLDQARSNYADLYLESQSVIERLRLMELRAAHLLRQKEGTGLDKGSSEVLEALEQAGHHQLAVDKSLREFEQSLATMLDVLKPSDALRRELAERLQSLKSAVEQSLIPMSIVTERGRDEAATRGCGVLSIHGDLQIVIVDRGSLAGVRPGMRFCLVRGDETLAVVKMTEVRSGLSAGVLVEGRLETLSPGTLLMPEKH